MTRTKGPAVYMSTLLCAALLSACGGSTLARSELKKRQEQWAGQNIPSYRYTLQISCFCSLDLVQPVVIEVRDGVPASIVAAQSAAPVAADGFSAYDSMEDMFSVIQYAHRRNAAQVLVTYDIANGFPTSISLDDNKRAIDDEASISIANFEVLE